MVSEHDDKTQWQNALSGHEKEQGDPQAAQIKEADQTKTLEQEVMVHMHSVIKEVTNYGKSDLNNKSDTLSAPQTKTKKQTEKHQNEEKKKQKQEDETNEGRPLIHQPNDLVKLMISHLSKRETKM